VTGRAATLAFAAIATCGCSGPTDRSREQSRLRVAASYGISKFELSAHTSGSTAAALDLVWTSLETHTDAPVLDGATVRLRRKQTSPNSSAELARAVRFRGLTRAHVDTNGEIVAQFGDATTARAFADVGGFDLGPYEVEIEEPGRVVLRARGRVALRAIEIVEVPLGDQWRQLLGNRIDVIPNASALYGEQFRGIRSIRLVPLPLHTNVSLVFNTQHASLSDIGTRRRIAMSIDRQAVAAVACGTAKCAAGASGETGATAPSVAKPRLSLISLEGHAHHRLAAEVLRHQLREVGIEVASVELPLEQLREDVREGRFELAIAHLPVDRERRFYGFSSAGTAEGLNLAHYSSAEMEAALAEGNLDAAEAIMNRDLPVFPLYELREFAAIDSRFCGGTPTSSISWNWLAELYPCEEDHAR